MFLGIYELGDTLEAHIQLADGNAPATADADPTFRIYKGETSTPVQTGTASGVVDSQTGWHKISQALTAGNSFASGTVYTIRVAYDVSSVAKAQEYSFQIA